MNISNKKNNFPTLALMGISLLLLSACSGVSDLNNDKNRPELFSKSDISSKRLLNEKDDNTQVQLLTINALIKEGKFSLADAIITHLETKELSPNETASFLLVTTDFYLAQNKFNDAAKYLEKVVLTDLSKVGQFHYFKQRVSFYSMQNLNEETATSLFELLQYSDNYKDLLTDIEFQKISDQLLESLSKLENERLHSLFATQARELNADPLKLTWYSLATLYQEYKTRPNYLNRKVEQWKGSFATASLIKFMPSQLANISKLTPYKPLNISVVLPLSGRFSVQGKAIQFGMLHAYYMKQENITDIQKNLEGSLKNIDDLNIQNFHFIDSNKKNMKEIARDLKSNKTDFVIGPLLKDNIVTLMPLIKDLPSLALNAIDQESMDPKIHYYFPISPENEAMQAAQKIFQSSHSKPLIIAPDSSKGKRLAQAFKLQWKELSLNPQSEVETYFFSNKQDLNKFVADLLQTKNSKTRINQMKAITQLPLVTSIRSRRDIDAIYIISKRKELNLIKPFIDVSISSFAESVPLFASSRSNSLQHSPKANYDLQNIVFSDIPFLINKNDPIKNDLKTMWDRSDFTSLRLFALGFDSFQIIEELIQLQMLEDYTYQGLTGVISMDSSNTLNAVYSWAKYNKGKLIEIASPVTIK